jgi:hypothetical protein
MFSNLTNYAYKRSPLQALGFYIAYLILIILVGGVLGGIAGLLFEENSFAISLRLGVITAIITCLALAILVVSKKNQWSNFLAIFLIVLSPFLAFLLGGIGGLLPVSYLTTLEKKAVQNLDK